METSHPPPLRVALVTDAFLPVRDERTTTVRQVADRLIDTGHQVRILAPGPGLTSYRGAPVTRIGTWARLGHQLRTALEEQRPDLVHVTSPDTVGRSALKQARRLELPTVVVEQAAVPRFAPDYWREGVAERADRLVVTSRWMRDVLVDQDLVAHLWEPGVDTDAFHPRLRSDELHGRWSRAGSPDGPDVVVGYAGPLHKRHGVRRLRHLAGLRGVRLVVIGDGPQRGWLSTHVPGAVVLPAMGTGDLGVALASLDVFVHPGRKETCAHALRAASASGVPVVAHRAGGALDVVRHLETGLFSDTPDGEGLRLAVRAVAGDRHRVLLGRAGRWHAEHRGWPQAVDELVRQHYLAAIAIRAESRAA